MAAIAAGVAEAEGVQNRFDRGFEVRVESVHFEVPVVLAYLSFCHEARSGPGIF